LGLFWISVGGIGDLGLWTAERAPMPNNFKCNPLLWPGDRNVSVSVYLWYTMDQHGLGIMRHIFGIFISN